jgi:hypothetical protein
VLAMLRNLDILFKPTARQVRERMSNLERSLDVIAKNAAARFSRGNVSMQMGLFESSEELEDSRKRFIKRRA